MCSRTDSLLAPLLVALVAVALSASGVRATDIRVEHVESVRNPLDARSPFVAVTVSWDNAWFNERNHDAAWLFFKVLRPSGYQHLYLIPESGVLLAKGEVAMPDADVLVADDGTGAFVRPASTWRGRLQYRVLLRQDAERTPLNAGTEIAAYAVEMVYIPEGPVELGDPDPRALDYGAFFRSDASGRPAGTFRITAADQEIPVGPDAGSLYYQVRRDIYQGDQSGPIPGTFPNGFAGFYLMKYEVSQGEYAAFLSSLAGWPGAGHRANVGDPLYRERGGSIRMTQGRFVADHPDRRNVFWHWDDMMAFTDWAGLRPYTEFEFTKAARGPLEPQPLEYPWNSADFDVMQRRIHPESQDAVMLNGLDESDMTEANRAQFGASYYWVMDLAGSMWEKVVTAGDEVGRAFTGNHGDGTVDSYGDADVAGWPSGYKASKGYGYRGGGYYGRAVSQSDFNPFSPIALRTYGAWSGGPRNAAYGFRAARTAPR
ncbi:MAG: SUMF1/EgtB/PvdO family nonheme iron enzyme [Rhodothermales bacterium]|nr:SUMF1/EgtB/PvdO family nonheme iron enzyme [Rhodothermales bacterium]MBO6780615.1 SUMF1/EgtB/PvdO family nonheme iron enzyme [Rhodothermales bacterium]